MSKQDYYALLGVPRTATAAEIVQAFRNKAMALHPDRNKDNPETTKLFKLVSQAYHALTDPVLRTKYDASLPAEVVAPVRISFTIAELWKITGKLYLDRSTRYTKAVDALQKSVAIVIDEDSGILIVGFEPVNAMYIGYLESSETHNTVKAILTEVYGKSLDFRIITGTTLLDYQQLKDAESRLAKRQQSSSIDSKILGKATVSSTTTATLPISAQPANWAELQESIAAAWTATQLHELPQVKAAFALKQLPALIQLEKQTETSEEQADVQRKVARILKQIATLAGIDATVLAMEYVQYKSRII